jgi:hypothetical protein
MSKVICRALCAAMPLAFVLGYSLADDPPPCYVTQIGNKCGTDYVVRWVACGEGHQQCNLEEYTYDNLWTAVQNSWGKMAHPDKVCYQHYITRECNAQGVCAIVTNTSSPMATGSQAAGNDCP